MDPDQERLIRDGYAAFARGDLDTALATFLPDSTFTNPEYAVETGVRTGFESVRAGFRALYDEFDYTAIDVEEIVDGPGGYVAVVHVVGRGKLSGAPLDVRFFHAFTTREGRVVDFSWFTSLEEARQAVGL
jgi:ketosteroid isomerase-like protein